MREGLGLPPGGFPNVHQLNGGIIEYTRQVRARLENRFIGKNQVFDERLAERIQMTSSLIAINAAPPAMTTPIAPTWAATFFIQCPCAEKYEGTCERCQDHSPARGRAAGIEKGKKDSARIFNKAASAPEGERGSDD